MKKKGIIFGIGMAAVIFSVILSGCTEEEDDGDKVTIMINGEETSLGSIFDDHGTMTIFTGGNNYTGVSLSELINDTGLASPEDHQYRITAKDGWNQDVTWNDMMKGVLVEEETMTAFPGLPGKYRIRDVMEIKPVSSPTIEVNGNLYVWPQIFHIIDYPVEMTDNDNNTIEGVYLSAVINLTGLSDQETHSYNIVGNDGYNQTVTWGDMEKGLLVLEGNECFFPHLEKKYNISDIGRIEVI